MTVNTCYNCPMNQKNILIIAAVAIIFLVLGYWIAMPSRKAVAPENGVSIAVVSIRDASSSQIYKIAGEYPQFTDASADFNAAIANYVGNTLSEFKKDSEENWQARIDTMPTGTQNTLPAQAFTFSASWTPEQINKSYISIIVRLDYFNGGANGAQLLKTFNYDVATKKMMTLNDLFPNVSDLWLQIVTQSRQQLDSSIGAKNAIGPMIEEGTAPTSENYANFMFNDDVVTIYFPKYQVAPGVFGEQRVRIVRSTIN